MKFSLPLAALAATSASAHTIFQRVSVNGVDQGQLVGVRAPASDNPVQNVNAAELACNLGLASPVSTSVITVPAGAKVGTWWQHILGGAQGANDPDNPIAASHKGPIQIYLAKVSSFLSREVIAGVGADDGAGQ
jgi:cellulase